MKNILASAQGFLSQITHLIARWEEGLWLTGVVTALAIGAILVWQYWDDLDSDLESLSTTVRNVALVIGGVVALLLAIWRSRIGERQVTTAQQGLLNERYQKGAEMLGSNVLSVRMGGIYALQKLAEEHPKEYHIQIMNLLGAFVRHPTRDETILSVLDDRAGKDEQTENSREDVQAVMQIIGHRSQSTIDAEESNFALDLRGADLRGVRLWGANLSKANLDGANLRGVQLTTADLSEALLRRADLSQTETIDANLSGAILDHADFSDAELDGTNLARCQMLETRLPRARLIDVNLSGALLSRADLSESHLMGADMSDTHLLAANVSGAFFRNPTADDTFSGFWVTTDTPIRGLRQSQLDLASSDPDNPPKLEGVLDDETGEQLIWRGSAPEE